MTRWGMLTMLGLAAGCATTSRFTTQAELDKVRAAPRPVKVFQQKSRDVPSWELAGPFPEQIGDAPHQSSDAWSRLFVDRAAAKGLRASQPLACIARETARFIAANGEYPGSLLTRFITARCGESAPHVGLQSFSGDVPVEVSDDELFSRWKDNALAMVDHLAAGELGGLAVVREKGKAVVVVARVARLGALEPMSIFPADDNTVTLRGAAPGQARQILAYANQGHTRSVPCRDTGRLQLPSFEVVCPVEKTDTTAWIELGAADPGRVLGYGFADVLVWPGRQPSSSYVRPSYGTPGGEVSPEGLLAKLNEVRAQGGLAPMALSPAQTADNRELVPFLFDANVRNDALTQDRIALGVMAGWRVESQISGGTVTTTSVESPELSLLLASQLESAGTRAQLLSPDNRVLAIGLYREDPFLAAMVSAYPPVEATSWPQSTTVAVTQLNEARGKAGQKPAKWLTLPANFEPGLAGEVNSRSVDSEEALQRLMSATSELTRAEVHGWRIHTDRLASIEWPEALLKKPNLEVFAVVAVDRPKGEPWAQYVLVVVTPERAE